jgi:hypothetical protein
MDGEERFAALAEEFAGSPDVTLPGADDARGFGANALRVRGSIFAMRSGGRLVVKLPAKRVAELIAAGDGEPFNAGKGRPMREWITVADDADWLALAREALAFVAAKRR